MIDRVRAYMKELRESRDDRLPRRRRAPDVKTHIADVHLYIFALEQVLDGVTWHQRFLASYRSDYERALRNVPDKEPTATYRAVAQSYVCLLEQKLSGADVPDDELRTVKQTYVVVIDDVS
jgi:hypothetical protein